MEYENPVAFFFNGHGDHILVAPTLRALAQTFSKRLTLICARGASLRYFSGLPLWKVIETEFYLLPDGERWFDVEEVSRSIELCDLFLSLTDWHNLTVRDLIFRLNPTMSIGLCPGFMHEMGGKESEGHSADKAFTIAKKFYPGAKLESFSHPPEIDAKMLRLARKMLSEWAHGRKVLTVHNETADEKVWPINRLAMLLVEFLGLHEDFIAIIVSKGPPQMRIPEPRQDRIFFCDGLPIEVAYGLVKRSDVFLGVDSCMLHMADFCRIPSVGLFGPTSCSRWGCRLGRHRHVSGGGKMQGIRIADVLNALEEIVAGGGAKPAAPA